MAATATVPHLLPFRKSARPGQVHQSLIPRHGVVTLFGYGITIRVDRGHLILEDGVGDDRRAGRFARVNHGIRRVIVIGDDGSVSLAALRWLADQSASFLMLERDGSVLVTTGPVAASDARLRRAQTFAEQSGAALMIVRELIERKLRGQEDVARNKLSDIAAADSISRFRAQLERAETLAAIRVLEAQGSQVYWSAWRSLPTEFPRSEVARVPDHWRSFGSRQSPLTGSPRHAVTPANAILNYLYALLESETRLAAAALGLDPGLGLLHFDYRNRDSLACDLMEPIRPKVDAYLLDWITRSPLRREWFFEQRDGNCRLMATFAARLSETVMTWRREVAPVVEWFAETISASTPNPTQYRGPGTRLATSTIRTTPSAEGTASHRPFRDHANLKCSPFS
jgi:CRISPR-associated protein Cas1